MTEALVIDASVAVQWVLPESFSAKATALLTEATTAKKRLVCPPHLKVEVCNAIYQQLRRGNLTPAEAEESITTFLSFELTVCSPARLYQHAFVLARSVPLPTIYNSCYVALSELLQIPLWTADQRLRNALGSRYPQVRWIGEYPMPTAEAE